MGRKASTKIKVHLEIDEIRYQRLAVIASGKNKTVTDFLQQISDELGSPPPEILFPLTPHPAPLVEAPAAPAQHSPQTAIESNADSATEHEKPRKRR